MLFCPYKVKMFLSYVISVSGLVFIAFRLVLVVLGVGSSLVLALRCVFHWKRSIDTNLKSEARTMVNEKQFDVKNKEYNTTARCDIRPLKQR